MVRVVFEIEQAGCESCAKLISTVLSRVGIVESIEIDENVDTATVALAEAAGRAAVDSALEEASSGSGHSYRVRAGSWRPLD